MDIKAKARILSITINNEFIKICEVTKGGKSIIVHKAVTIPTPERSYSDGMIRDRGALAKTIKVALDDNRITTNNVVYSLASTKIATKEVIIPNVKSNKIADIINTNATEYFPVNIEEYIIEYSVLEHLVDDENKIKVQVMAAPSEMIEAYYDLSSSLGFTINAIDYVGNSTYQGLKRQIDAAPSIVIQVENDATIVNIFNNNVLQLQRTIPYGKSVLVNAIMDAYTLKYEPALKKLQTEDLLHSSFGGDAITESLRYLVGNVNRIIDYYTTRNSNKPIERAYVIGNATTISGFNELFAHELNLSLVSIDKLKEVICDKKTYLDASTLPNYITNLGAFIAPVNFVPKNIAKNTKERDYSKFVKFVLTASIIGSIILVMVPLVTMLSAKSNRDTTKQNVDSIKDIESVVSDYYNAHDIALEALAFKTSTASNDDALGKFISTLETEMPSDISIKSMNVTDGVATLTGGASSKSSVALMIQKLSAIDYVSSVKVGSETETKDNAGIVSVTFSLACQFNQSVLSQSALSQNSTTSK